MANWDNPIEILSTVIGSVLLFYFLLSNYVLNLFEA